MDTKFKILLVLIGAFLLRLLTFSFNSLVYLRIDFFVIALFILLFRQKIELWHVAVVLLYGMFIDMLSLNSWGLTSFVLISTVGVLKFFEKNFSPTSFISVFVFGLFLFGFFLLLWASADILVYRQIDIFSSRQLVISLLINSALFALITVLYGEKPQKIY